MRQLPNSCLSIDFTWLLWSFTPNYWNLAMIYLVYASSFPIPAASKARPYPRRTNQRLQLSLVIIRTATRIRCSMPMMTVCHESWTWNSSIPHRWTIWPSTRKISINSQMEVRRRWPVLKALPTRIYSKNVLLFWNVNWGKHVKRLQNYDQGYSVTHPRKKIRWIALLEASTTNKVK